MSEQALCPVFGECGGCQYQNIPYGDELKIKQEEIRRAVSSAVAGGAAINPIVPSPQVYHYRHRLDLKLRRLKDGRVLVGFTPGTGRGVVEVDACPIAIREVSDFIPRLKLEAQAALTPKYRLANLVVKTGADGRVRWGGIGRKSCRLQAGDYLWAEVCGRRVHYSLDTFFQANLSILPVLFAHIRALPLWDNRPDFFDLYGGVGLFSFALADLAGRAWLIEDCKPAVELARYNAEYNRMENITIVEGRVEDRLPGMTAGSGPAVGMIDPPRAGLSAGARALLAASRAFDYLLYLSCNPGALAVDLKDFAARGWQIMEVTPFDFFPRTKHVETLVVLKAKKG